MPEPGRPRVGLFHPGTQHFYRTARALQQAGLLAWFATEVFYDERRWPYRGLRCLPRRLRTALESECRRRHDPELDPDLVRTSGVWEWLEIMAYRLRRPALARRLNRTGNIRFARRVGEMARRDRPEVLWGANTSSREAFATARTLGIKCVLDLTSPPPSYWEALVAEEVQLTTAAWPVDHPWDAAASAAVEAEMALADVIAVGSTFVQGTVPEAWRAKTVVCPYGADVSGPAPVAEPQPGPPTILYVGRLSALKGVRYLLEAAALLHGTVPFRLRLVGALGVAPAEFARHAAYAEHVPHVPHREIGRAYAQADILVQPSLGEGLSRVLLEGAAAGLPVVATPSTGVETVLVPGESCLLVPPRDVTGLAEALGSLLTDPDRRREMGRQARRQATQFTWERYGRQVAEIVTALAGTAGDPGHA